MIQFVTRYQHWTGSQQVRVTKIERSWTEVSTVQLDKVTDHRSPKRMRLDETSASLTTCPLGFDPKAAAVLVARLAVRIAEENVENKVVGTLLRHVIRLVSYEKISPKIFPSFDF